MAPAGRRGPTGTPLRAAGVLLRAAGVPVRAAGTLLRAAALLLAGTLLMAVGGCDAPEAWQRQAMGRAYFDSTGTYVDAGVSTRIHADIEPLRPSSLGTDADGRAAHLYRMRCGACHTVPDPGMRTGEHWSFLMSRMRNKSRSAGLLPMTEAEADTILSLLRSHADD